MSRELSRKQKSIILCDIQHNKLRGYQDPYVLRSSTRGRLTKVNNFENLYQSVESYLYDLRMNDGDHYDDGVK